MDERRKIEQTVDFFLDFFASPFPIFVLKHFLPSLTIPFNLDNRTTGASELAYMRTRPFTTPQHHWPTSRTNTSIARIGRCPVQNQISSRPGVLLSSSIRFIDGNLKVSLSSVKLKAARRKWKCSYIWMPTTESRKPSESQLPQTSASSQKLQYNAKAVAAS